MKYNKIFRTLALAIILSLLVIAIPASPALAYDYDVDLDPRDGEIGTYFYVEGDGFPASNTITREVDIYFSSEEADTGDDIDYDVNIYERLKIGVAVDEFGEFRKRVKVPTILNDGHPDEDVHGGTYYVYVTNADSDDIKAVAEFTVLGGWIEEISPETGPVGTEVEISGAYFAGYEDITIEYDGDVLDIVDGDEETDRHGEFDCIIIIPDSTAGDHIIVAEDESEHRAEALFTVEPTITRSPASGSPATEVTISGTGFKASKSITITFDDTTVTTSPALVTSDSDGSFSNVKFNVPTLVSDTYEVKASDGTNDDALDFTISITASCSPTTGNVGTPLTVSGSGFVAGRTLIVRYDTTEVAMDIVGTDGTFSVTFNAPASPGGTYTITATDGINTRQFTFTMESTPPPAPAPRLPLMDSIIEEESPVCFDWDDVLDDSPPITYTLQVASDPNFTTIVLEKVGLTQSEYTLTEAERETLVPTEEEAVYYWMVKAIDGASNEGGWSGVGSFLILRSTGFTLPDWAIYVLFGVGALLFGILGFWLGKRSAYRYY